MIFYATSYSSMDPVPFDYRLFDPPPKQHKQPTTQSPHQQQQHQRQQQQQQTQFTSSSQNSTNNTNLSGGLSGGGKIRTKNTDTNSSSGSSSHELQQCTSGGFGANTTGAHIVQSGSYVEILKQTNNSNAGAVAGGSSADPLRPERKQHQKQRNLLPALTACHNKSYGDFLTITPRRKGKLLANVGDKTHHGGVPPPDSYHHHLPHSIEPLHLLGIPNDNMSTFFDYRAMETLSNADTLAIGSTMAGGGGHYNKHSNKPIYSTGMAASINTNTYGTTTMPDDFQHILNEKNLSPPSAFSDSIAMDNNKSAKLSGAAAGSALTAGMV